MAAVKPLIKKGLFALVLVVIAVSFYYLTIWVTPYYVQKKFAEKSLGVINTPQFGNQPDAENSRVIPLPNPDFLYSTINYDLNDQVLKISGTVPDSTYWSISAYQENTTNYFVQNEEQVKAKFEYYLALEGSTSEVLKNIPKEKIIYSPTTKGLILFRYLVSKAYPVKTLAELQHGVTVEKLVK
ncbi:putative membrane protein [Flavobacterium sp. 90]|uniref:DUF1254 domain-containing protein n=1 Tax=unclassified Flavobacterium TaxID=196869 RepID=UPI000EB117FE|nr:MULTISPECIES: DUF1254 domain-containing protein [unclassified Flavobacterium]RKR11794.1 putative membrane protein [Flavobacterium sp. 81]TCK55569.1 putative membrane protein [Flavobacterium sp. 90]